MQEKSFILWSWFTEEDLMKYHISRESAKFALYLMTQVCTYRVFVLFHKENDRIKAHFRSQGDVDVSRIARMFGG